MAIKELTIGSNNPAKIDEWKKLLGSDVRIKGIAELGDFPEPKETGSTFAENAKLKARYYALLTGSFVLADDAGFEVDALGGEPGVKSRRILPGNKEGTDRECVDYVLGRMKTVPKEKRGAQLVVHVALADHKGKIIYEDNGRRVGYITEESVNTIIPGYPYRSILYIPEVDKTYDKLTEKEYDKLNHRKKLAERLKKFLRTNRV
ncbi:MAG TPA: non-canonical purine NTP pyrophosphatase [Patescibacteria group bacterium]|nr:non-canonical purine NTP pyrophosphatase [Patescibacteria group bacterium]